MRTRARHVHTNAPVLIKRNADCEPPFTPAPRRPLVPLAIPDDLIVNDTAIQGAWHIRYGGVVDTRE